MPDHSETLNSILAESPTLSAFLRSVQARLHWVPREAMNIAADRFNTTYMAVYEQVAFSPAFSLEERGRVVFEVCHGLACKEAGSVPVLRALEQAGGIQTGQTKADGSLSICRQACFGRCAIGPNLRVNGDYFANQTPESATALLRSALAKP